MRDWFELYEQHTDLRSSAKDADQQIRRVLRRLAEPRESVFDRNVHARLVPEKNPRNNLRGFRLDEALDLSKLPAEDRKKLDLQDASLQVRLLIDLNKGHLHTLTVMAQGTRKTDGSQWQLAVHLSDDQEKERGDRQGRGACGHAALHCHPTLGFQPGVRVPLPPLSPGQVVEWVLSQVIPAHAFEPAPWPELQ